MGMAIRGQVCTDTFLINLLGNLQCTFEIQNPATVQGVYGTTRYVKKFLYTPGTFVDANHDNFGFRAVYTPSPGFPTANPPIPADPNFPPGVTLTGSFVDAPDLSGNRTEAKMGEFHGEVTIDRDDFPGENNLVRLGYSKDTRVSLIFNPGVDI